LRARLHKAMVSDRLALARDLDRFERRRGSVSHPSDDSVLSRLEGRLDASVATRALRRSRLPALTYPEALPITAKRQAIVEAIRRNRVVVITGATGSGKTTQIPKMCLEAGRAMGAVVGCTQPRRVAAVTVAERIAEELGEPIGTSVGYKIRFQEQRAKYPYIKIMTDGVLLAEAQSDRLLSQYDTVIVDEAHERSLNIDLLLGILKGLLRQRRDLKVVITSATIDTEKFSAAFGGAPVVEVSGRMYPVQVEYEPFDAPVPERDDEWNYVEAAVRAVEDCIRRDRRGDILVFMPTENDIREACELLESRMGGGNMVLPLFARLSGKEQRRVFQSFPERKIIVATNVAETSITIPGIRYVIDTGLARISQYNPRTRTSSLPVLPISQSSADQRAGRCGRVENGVCIRLYPRQDYEMRPVYTPAELLRSNLAEVLLKMVALKVGDVTAFPFIDPPPAKSIQDGFQVLTELGALRTDTPERGPGRDKRIPRLTDRGRIMARMPLDPRISRILIEAATEYCLEQAAVIAAALSIQDPRERPVEQESEADRIHASFADPSSDFASFLNLWRRYDEQLGSGAGRSRLRKFCKDHFLSHHRMREWRDVHEQILDICRDEGLGEKRGPPQGRAPGEEHSAYAALHRSICSGFLSSIAMRRQKNIYQAAHGKEAMLFPGSGLFNRGGPWIVAAEMVVTSRLFARTAANIEPEWLEALGKHLCRSHYSEPHWEKKRGEVVAYEQVTLFGLPIVPRRPVSYGPIDPETSCSLFIRSALVEGEVAQRLPFLLHNQEVVREVMEMEERLRRRDLLAGEERQVDFYATRLPGVYDVATLKHRIKERGGDAFLRMTPQDVLLQEPDPQELRLFPDAMPMGAADFPFSYRFQPNDPADGVTLRIPSQLVGQVAAERLEWLVPGLLKEKVTALLKGLPKELRRKLVPLTRAVEILLPDLAGKEGPLLTALAESIAGRFGVQVPSSAWQVEALSPHLRMRLAVVDAQGREICAGRDVGLLQTDVGARPGKGLIENARRKWEREGITAWDFGPLAPMIPLGDERQGGAYAFPALVPGDRCVRLRLFLDQQEALEAHRKGVAALCALHLAKDCKQVRRLLGLAGDEQRLAVYFGGPHCVEKALYDAVLHAVFGKDVRTGEEFSKLVGGARPFLFDKARAMREAAIRALDAYTATRTALAKLESDVGANRVALAFFKKLRAELEHIAPPTFLSLYDEARLANLVRYLRALTIRAERGWRDLEKERARSEKLEVFSTGLRRLLQGLPACATGRKREALEELFWMIEEYKVSLFAQELRTPFPISEKRLENKLREIERMV